MANLQIVPTCRNVEAQYVEMMVPLYSYGCEKKVKKTLAGIKGKYKNLHTNTLLEHFFVLFCWLV